MKKYSFITEDADWQFWQDTGTGAGVGAAVGGTRRLWHMWLDKYVRETKNAIISSETPEEAYQKYTALKKSDALIFSRRLLKSMRDMDQELRNISLERDDPQWKEKMLAVVNIYLRRRFWKDAAFMSGTALTGAALGALYNKAR